jgi:hypothetical protein
MIYAIISTRSTYHLYYVIPLALLSSFGLYFTFSVLLGYPTTFKKNEKFNMISYHVYEDNIYIWVVHIDEYEPIAYTMPYSEEKHAMLESAKQRIESGMTVIGEFPEEISSEELNKEENGNAGSGTIKSRDGMFELHNIDPRKYLPEKF